MTGLTIAGTRVDAMWTGARMELEVGADKIEWRAVADLVPYARNARTHSDEQISVLAASIGRYGFNNPVLIDTAGGIIAGHGRVLAAKRLGMETVPVVPLAHLTEDEKRAYILADNKTAELSGWDEDLLRIEVADLADKDFDMGGLGFDEKEIAKLLVEPEPEAGDGGDGEPDPDAALEAKPDPVSALGDVWVMGAHRLICGDSTDPATLEALQGGGLGGHGVHRPALRHELRRRTGRRVDTERCPRQGARHDHQRRQARRRPDRARARRGRLRGDGGEGIGPGVRLLSLADLRGVRGGDGGHRHRYFGMHRLG